MQTFKTFANGELPKNSYECMGWVIRFQSQKSVYATSVAFVLASFWNMDGNERCNPSLSTIMAKSGVKSRQGVRDALEELEASGEWVVVRHKAPQRNDYYPMFVANARKDLLGGVEQQKALRKETEKHRKAQAKAKKEAEAGFDALEAATDYSTMETVVEAFSPDPRIQTQRDQDIVDQYLEVQAYKAEHHEWSVPLPVEGEIVDVLDEEELSLFTQHGNPGQLFVAGAEDRFEPEYAAVWMEKFGAKYGSKVTYSTVQDVYDELFYGDNPMDAGLADAAMYVMGVHGIGLNAKYIRLLAFPRGRQLEPEQEKLHKRIIATFEGRKQTVAYSYKNHYGNKQASVQTRSVIAMDETGRVYSDVM